jgi:aspartyl aminopeptidase
MRMLVGLTLCRGLVCALAPPPLTTITPQQISLAKEAMQYIDASPDPFHAVMTSVDLLRQAGFRELSGAFKGQLQPGGKYYYVKDKSTLVAFAIGSLYNAESVNNDDVGGFKIIGAHTDSPNLRVKPRSKRKSRAGWMQLGVECYGGGLWHTWFDRDLGLSGRVFVKHNDKIEQRFIKLGRAILRIPNLAIHLQTAKEREAFVYNKEDHLSPVLATEARKLLTGDDDEDNSKEASDDRVKTNGADDGWSEYQSLSLLKVLSQELNAQTEDIVDFELCLFDVQPAAFGGAFSSEFIHSARLDNLASCFISVKALVEHVDGSMLADDKDISMIVLFDHEEVGSSSAKGAASPIIAEAVRRITAALHSDNLDLYDACIRRSFVLSSDQAHAVHPNYVSKHENEHQPRLNRGMVIKRNANQRYATTTATGLVIREIARRASLPPLQEFVVRQDCGCGSTIGPIISAATGIRAIDVGCPQLSMHSIRETMGVCDIQHGLNLFKAFFEHLRAVDESMDEY